MYEKKCAVQVGNWVLGNFYSQVRYTDCDAMFEVVYCVGLW